jgi:dimethylsulfone monooxygenase
VGDHRDVDTRAGAAEFEEHFVAGWAGYPLIGNKEQVVDGLALLERAGFDGIVLSWPRYIEDVQRFQAETLPLVKQAGLR